MHTTLEPIRIQSVNMTSFFFNLIGCGRKNSKWPNTSNFISKVINSEARLRLQILLQRPQWSPKWLKISLEESIKATKSFKALSLSKGLELAKVYFGAQKIFKKIHFSQNFNKHLTFFSILHNILEL